MVIQKPLLVTGTESDNPCAIDIALFCGQNTEISDILSLKTFANTEFCPRFIGDETDMESIGKKLTGMTVAIVSTASNSLSRNELAWRNLLVARAAKDNGAQKVILVEPDLYYSAQDRGPRPDHGEVAFPRDVDDYKKFDGQPFTSRFYAESLHLAGVDAVITVHNHSVAVSKLFSQVMPGGFLNLSPAEVFADYILNSDVTPSLHSGNGLLICAPDKGARGFAIDVHNRLKKDCAGLLYISKQRTSERSVVSAVDPDSPYPLEGIAGKDVIVFDDMVRTGTTIKECCRLLKEAGASRVAFFVTHFYSSSEGRETLNTPALDEIITTNTIPSILNRDMQGRLRRKLTVLKLEKWISRYMLAYLGQSCGHLCEPMYTVDMSSKNPRWRG
jgi:ribose-phosphate pyrophosphokinase